MALASASLYPLGAFVLRRRALVAPATPSFTAAHCWPSGRDTTHGKAIHVERRLLDLDRVRRVAHHTGAARSTKSQPPQQSSTVPSRPAARAAPTAHRARSHAYAALMQSLVTPFGTFCTVCSNHCPPLELVLASRNLAGLVDLAAGIVAHAADFCLLARLQRGVLRILQRCIHGPTHPEFS